MITHVGLFEGYGGTSMAAARALGPLNTLWVSDIKPASITLLRHRHPDVPNLGNLKLIHWPRTVRAYGRPDLVTASWPCQPHSSAGKRLGEADPRALWPNVVDAIAALRPRIFLGENVARITSNGELRRVVRSLADLGYVGAWRVQRASDVYAPHRRERCFVVAVDPAAYAHAGGQRPHIAHTSAGEPDASGGGQLTLLPTPAARDGKGVMPRGPRADGYARSIAQLDLPGAIQLLPTPTARLGDSSVRGADAARYRGPRSMNGRRSNLDDCVAAVDERAPWMADRLPGGSYWGVYSEAIARWGCAFDREAPAPTQLGTKGQPQLSPGFVEWMMGLPQGHVTGVPGLTRNQQLSLLGDGVVPQQGAAAFSFLLGHLAQRLAVAA